jgi:hypothetical protein
MSPLRLSIWIVLVLSWLRAMIRDRSVGLIVARLVVMVVARLRLTLTVEPIALGRIGALGRVGVGALWRIERATYIVMRNQSLRRQLLHVLLDREGKSRGHRWITGSGKSGGGGVQSRRN